MNKILYWEKVVWPGWFWNAHPKDRISPNYIINWMEEGFVVIFFLFIFVICQLRLPCFYKFSIALTLYWHQRGTWGWGGSTWPGSPSSQCHRCNWSRASQRTWWRNQKPWRILLVLQGHCPQLWKPENPIRKLWNWKPLPLTSVDLIGLSTVNVFWRMWSGLMPNSSSRGGSSSNPEAPAGAAYDGAGWVSGMNMAPV